MNNFIIRLKLYVGGNGRELKGKTMTDKLMYIPNDDI